MEELCSSYIGNLMDYIAMEYDNIPDKVTDEMQEYFLECFGDGRCLCLPNAAGGFWERFLQGPENL